MLQVRLKVGWLKFSDIILHYLNWDRLGPMDWQTLAILNIQQLGMKIRKSNGQLSINILAKFMRQNLHLVHMMQLDGKETIHPSNTILNTTIQSDLFLTITLTHQFLLYLQSNQQWKGKYLFMQNIHTRLCYIPSKMVGS